MELVGGIFHYAWMTSAWMTSGTPSLANRFADRYATDLMSAAIRGYFSRHGRLSRGGFWRRTLLAWLLFWLVFALLEGVSPVDLTRIPAAILIWSLFCLCSQRCHDLDRSSLRLLWLLVPLLGLVFIGGQLGFGRGTVGENRFGIDPRDVDGTTRRDYATVT